MWDLETLKKLNDDRVQYLRAQKKKSEEKKNKAKPVINSEVERTPSSVG